MQSYLIPVPNPAAFWEWGMGNWEWARVKEHWRYLRNRVSGPKSNRNPLRIAREQVSFVKGAIFEVLGISAHYPLPITHYQKTEGYWFPSKLTCIRLLSKPITH